uniref:ZP domain-containing protein n=1 Tax=Parascaris univalens TaxID=6257 RepID=A0A915ASY5_PARUN
IFRELIKLGNCSIFYEPRIVSERKFVLFFEHANSAIFNFSCAHSYTRCSLCSLIATSLQMDVDGCPVDPIIQPEVVYDDNLKRAVAETWGYKFSDTSVLNYQCVVELCRKDVGECDGLSPPSCGRSKREIKTVASRRSRRRTGFQPQTQMDLIATVNMLDSLDEDGISDPRTEKFIRKVSEHRFHPRSGIAISPANRTCLSRLTIGVFATTIAFTFIISAATTAILFKRTKKNGKM